MRRELTVLLSAEALLAFSSGSEVGVADGLVDVELLLFGWRHSLGGRAGQGGAFTLLYQAGKNTAQDVSVTSLVTQILKGRYQLPRSY